MTGIFFLTKGIFGQQSAQIINKLNSKIVKMFQIYQETTIDFNQEKDQIIITINKVYPKKNQNQFMCISLRACITSQIAENLMINFIFPSMRKFYEYLINQEQSSMTSKIRSEENLQQQKIIVGIKTTKQTLKQFNFQAYILKFQCQQLTFSQIKLKQDLQKWKVRGQRDLGQIKVDKNQKQLKNIDQEIFQIKKQNQELTKFSNQQFANFKQKSQLWNEKLKQNQKVLQSFSQKVKIVQNQIKNKQKKQENLNQYQEEISNQFKTINKIKQHYKNKTEELQSIFNNKPSKFLEDQINQKQDYIQSLHQIIYKVFLENQTLKLAKIPCQGQASLKKNQANNNNNTNSSSNNNVNIKQGRTKNSTEAVQILGIENKIQLPSQIQASFFKKKKQTFIDQEKQKEIKNELSNKNQIINYLGSLKANKTKRLSYVSPQQKSQSSQNNTLNSISSSSFSSSTISTLSTLSIDSQRPEQKSIQTNNSSQKIRDSQKNRELNSNSSISQAEQHNLLNLLDQQTELYFQKTVNQDRVILIKKQEDKNTLRNIIFNRKIKSNAKITQLENGMQEMRISGIGLSSMKFRFQVKYATPFYLKIGIFYQSMNGKKCKQILNLGKCVQELNMNQQIKQLFVECQITLIQKKITLVLRMFDDKSFSMSINQFTKQLKSTDFFRQLYKQYKIADQLQITKKKKVEVLFQIYPYIQAKYKRTHIQILKVV